ncbi:MAG: hypothetical protein H0V44_11800, partial [Planctomycetes bacterium]|nr:hypothetical protein [Planctomycetota bacterium]
MAAALPLAIALSLGGLGYGADAPTNEEWSPIQKAIADNDATAMDAT